MKQDEIKKIFKECKLDIYDSNGAKTEAIPFSRLEKFVTLYNQYLLSKKPSVSDEALNWNEINEDISNILYNGNGTNSGLLNIMEYLKSRIKANSLPPQVVQSEVSGDWVEDFSHENGNYLNTCIKCNNEFKGHKRRVVCKACSSLTPPDAEAVMFAEWIYKNYISNGIGKYYHNNWNGDLDTLVNYTTQELFTLYKQGGK